MTLQLTKEQKNFLAERVQHCAFSPEERKDPVLGTFYEHWNQAVMAVAEVLDIIIEVKEDPAC